MSFARPEAAAALTRWREALIGAGVAALGAWWAFGTGGLMTWIGGAVMLAGLALIAVGLQRGRFRLPGRGPGIVQVTEGQIAYLGPLTGGAVALSELSQLTLQTRAHPAHWVLSQPGQPDLAIPTTADGAEALFDAFARLPGLRTEYMLAQLKRQTDHPVVIWRKHGPLLH